MAFYVTPEAAREMVDAIERGWAWSRKQGFFGCSGMVAWAIIIANVILWLFRHVRIRAAAERLANRNKAK